MKKIIKILVLEDELSVIKYFTELAEEFNSNYFLGKEDFMISLTIDMGLLGEYDLENFDLIFIDRDNAVDPVYNNYHDKFLELFRYNFGHPGDLADIATRIYPFSGNDLNNNFLINEIIKILCNTKINTMYKDETDFPYYINNTKELKYYENILNNNTITKSFGNIKTKIKEAILKIK